MKDLMGMMKQVKDMQERMQRLQEELGAIEVTGAAGGGLVSVTLSGKGDMKRVRIDPSLLKPEEAEIPLDLQFIFQRVYDGGPYRRGAVD